MRQFSGKSTRGGKAFAVCGQHCAWALVPRLHKNETVSWMPAFMSLCFMMAEVMWPATSSPCSYASPTMTDCTHKLWARIKLSFPKLFLMDLNMQASRSWNLGCWLSPWAQAKSEVYGAGQSLPRTPPASHRYTEDRLKEQDISSPGQKAMWGGDVL